MARRQVQLNAFLMCWISLLSLVSVAVYLFYVGATVGQFPAARTAGERALLFAAYPDIEDCKAPDYDRFGTNWFLINSHLLFGIAFAILPIFYLFALFTKSAPVFILIYGVFSLGVIAYSVCGYIFIEIACASSNNGTCGKQCIYQAADWSAPKADGDITATDRVSTAFTVLRIVVPIMWALLLTSFISSIFAYGDVAKVTDKNSDDEKPEEEKPLIRQKPDRISSRTRNAAREVSASDTKGKFDWEAI